VTRDACTLTPGPWVLALVLLHNLVHPTREPNASPETLPAARRAFLCPACDAPTLRAAISDGVTLARCGVCGHEARDLLTLVPVQPVGAFTLTFGTGWTAVRRLSVFILVCAALLAIAVIGR
jgi:hypothetical protein